MTALIDILQGENARLRTQKADLLAALQRLFQVKVDTTGWPRRDRVEAIEARIMAHAIIIKAAKGE